MIFLLTIFTFLISIVFTNNIDTNFNLFLLFLYFSLLIILYKNFKSNLCFIIYSCLIGFFSSDYIDIFLINILLYLLISIFIIYVFKYFKKNILVYLTLNIFCIFIYESLLFLYLKIINYFNFDIFLLFNKIYGSLLLSSTYIIIFYILKLKK